MTNLANLGRERSAGRLALAIIAAGTLATLVVTAGGLRGQPALAQSTPAPTGPSIQFINPSGETGAEGPGTEISTQNDGVNDTFHLVAWTRALPASPSVEFKYQSGNNPEITIGAATLRGPDTYELEWAAGSVPDGAYTLKAILYSSGQQVARDEEPVEINSESPDDEVGTTEKAGATVEMTFPENVGQFGTFRKPGTLNPYAGVIDVSTSTDTTDVRAYYTTSVPGSEPSWIECATGASESVAGSQNGVRCTLDPSVSPSSVTAVSVAVTNPEETSLVPPSPGNAADSGDAHRVSAYVQTPSSVGLEPQIQARSDSDATTAGNQFPCSAVITAIVLDQNGRKVAGANVDVRAQGPTDNLFFDDTDATEDNTSSHQAPDSNHSRFESTVDCESSQSRRPFNITAGNQQGEHEVAGEGDPKHIESTPSGTNDAGQFSFQLYNQSTTITGPTYFSAYYDRNDDDRACSAEPAGDGTVGWGTPGPAPSPMTAETQTCPEPTASPSTSSSPSPSSSTSPSPSPSSSTGPGGDPVESGPCAGASRGTTTDRSEGGRIIVGTEGDDVLTGTDGEDIICGLGGRDVIDARAGEDIVTGDADKDQITGAEGADNLSGGAEKDLITGADGDDVLAGDNGNDNISGGSGKDLIRGHGGFDTLKGNAGIDEIYGNAGDDILQGGSDSDYLKAGGGKDVVKGFTGEDRLWGNGNDDVLKAGAGHDALRGGRGDDILNGGTGRDSCSGGKGSNIVRRCE